MWNTYRLDRDYSNVSTKNSRYDHYKPRSVLRQKPKEKKRPFTLDYVALSRIGYNIEEAAEEKIAKHALLEALF